MNLHQIPTHFGNVSIAPIGLNEPHYPSPVTISTTFINFLPAQIIIAERNGVKHTLKNEPNMLNNKLIIRVTRNIGFHSKEGLKKLISTINEESSAELQAIKEAYFLGNNNRASSFNIALDYSVSMDDLRNLGGTMYHNELDLLISLNSFEETPPHPYSTEGVKNRMMSDVTKDGDDIKLSYFLDLIDNSDRYGDRFLNIGNQIFRVRARKDSTRKDGIYRISNKPVNSIHDAGEKEVVYYPMEEAEKIMPIFKTIEDAKCLGDLSMAQKARVAELEREAINAKHDAAIAKNEMEKVQHERKLEAENIEAERARFNATLDSLRETNKFQFEQRSYERKDASELLKFIPTAIIGILSLIAIFRTSS